MRILLQKISRILAALAGLALMFIILLMVLSSGANPIQAEDFDAKEKMPMDMTANLRLFTMRSTTAVAVILQIIKSLRTVSILAVHTKILLHFQQAIT